MEMATRASIGTDAVAQADEHADGTGRTTMPRETLGTLRDARTHLRDVARTVPDDELERAITTLVELAWEAGFSRMATCSIVVTGSPPSSSAVSTSMNVAST